MSIAISEELSAKDLRNFGLTTGVIVAVLFGAFLPWIWDLRYPIWPWVFLLVLGLWALIAPNTLRTVYRVWMRFGLMISKVTTPIIMGIVFFLVVMPVGLLVRTIARDPMRRKFDKQLDSYRIDKQDESSSSLENPF